MSITSFLDQYVTETRQHPIIPRERIWENRVTLEVYPFSGRIHLASIYSLYPGEGHASQCLDWLINLAKTHEVTIDGTAKRFGRLGGMPTQQLKAWYKRHGAKFTQHSSHFLIGEDNRP